jgi:hypothetical protein
MPEQIVSSVFKWLSGGLAVLIGIIWRKNEARFESLESAIGRRATKTWVEEIDAVQDNLKKEFTDHKLTDIQTHEKFITHDYFHEYMEREIKPAMQGIATRVDASQKEIKESLKTLLVQTADVIKRTEYRQDLSQLHQKIDTKQDKRGSR